MKSHSLAVAYAMKRKAKKMAQGGSVGTLGSAIGYPGSPKPPKAMSQGGEVDDDEDGEELAMSGDLVDRIMEKRRNGAEMMSEGGKVANGSMTAGLADEEPNEFDDLVLRDDLSFSETDKNSGDEIGDAQEDQDRADIVARIMRSRAKRG